MSEKDSNLNKNPSPPADRGDIDWSGYIRAADTPSSAATEKTEQTPVEPPVPTEPEPYFAPPEDFETPSQPPEDQAPQFDDLRFAGASDTTAFAPEPSAEDFSMTEVPYEAPEPDDPVPPENNPEPTAPKKTKRRRKKNMGITFLVAMLYVVCVLSISFIAATLGWRWAGDMLALNKQQLSASVVVKAGDSVEQVADKLKDSGLIEYPLLFQVFASVTHKAESISSGTYDLNTDMDYSALLNNISAKSKARETVKVTIPEGYTVKEIFKLLDAQGVCSLDKLEYSAMNDDFSYGFLDGIEKNDVNWLEGYLFPDTYEFYKDGDAKVAISKILYNYSEKFDNDMKVRADRLGYTQREIMTIASIIEKETDGVDQRNIASVIFNRLETHGETLSKLQMDSTIQYILEERKEKLTQSDLEIDSPYNTYKNEGLPAGPICNPGMDSIQAALYPNTTTYYYFILGNDGETHFFSTYDEFTTYRDNMPEVTEEPEENDDAE